MPLVYVAAGSNLGNREAYLKKAEALVRGAGQIRRLRKSPVYETEPAGGPAQRKYLNGVWEIETGLRPEKLLERLLEIESSLGRVRGEKNAPRTIDLDILFYGDEVIKTKNLLIPHPRLHERCFVLRPLADLRPDLVHPALKKTIAQLLAEVPASERRKDPL